MNFDFEGALLTVLGPCIMLASASAFALNLVCSHFVSEGVLSVRLSPWFFAIFFAGGALACGAGLLLSSISTSKEKEDKYGSINDP